MSDKQFDDIIRKQLSNWEHKSQPDWETFIQKKKIADINYNNAKFDSAIKQKLEDYNKIPASGSWDTLNTRYLELEKQKSRVVFLKSLELLVLILLLIPLTSHLSWKNNSSNNIFVESAIHSENKRTGHHVIEERIKEDIVAEEISSNGLDAQLPSSIGTIIPFNSTENIIEETTLKKLVVEEQIHSNGEFFESEVVETLLNTGQFEYSNSLTETTLTDTDNIRNLEKLSNPVVLQPMQKLLNLGVRNIAIDFSELAGFQEVNVSNNENWFHIYGAIQNNIINSPIDEVYSVANNVSYAPGYSLGLKYSRAYNKLEFGTGLFYTKTKYQPYPVSEAYEALDGIHIISLKEIEYDQFSIPLEVHYSIFDHIDGSIFLSAGLSANVIWSESYDIEDQLDIPLPRPQGSQTQVDPARLMDKRFTSGLSGDLSFKDAFYLRGFFGIGVERNISYTTKFYLSGQYEHQLNNVLGPNNDKINLFTFGAGVKIKL